MSCPLAVSTEGACQQLIAFDRISADCRFTLCPSWFSSSAPSLKHMADCIAVKRSSTIKQSSRVPGVIHCLLQPWMQALSF